MPRGARQRDQYVDLGDGESGSKAQLRQRFGRDEDCLLVMQVQMDAPYKARYGAVAKTWDSVAERLNQHADFQMRPITGTMAKSRFDTLTSRHRQWMEGASAEDIEESDNPLQTIMSELIKEVDVRPKGTAKRLDGNDRDHKQDGERKKESRTRTRLGKRRSSANSDTGNAEPFASRKIFVRPRDTDTEQTQLLSDDLFTAAEVNSSYTEPIEEPAAPQSSTVGDLATVQQAIAELLKMQHAFATRPNETSVTELEKMTEARLREEKERTKQRDLELQIEMQRTKRRQLELAFEKEERKKDREEQAKLIASLVERLEPKKN